MRLYLAGGLFVLRDSEVFLIYGNKEVMPVLSCQPLELYQRCHTFAHVYEVQPHSQVLRLAVVSERIEIDDYEPLPGRLMQVKAPKRFRFAKDGVARIQARVDAHLEKCGQSEGGGCGHCKDCLWQASAGAEDGKEEPD